MIMKQYRNMKKLIVLMLLSIYISGCVDQKNETVNYNNSILPEYSPVVDLAKKDLSERLKIPADDIKLAKEEAIDWPDASIGFPEKGMMYAQVITPGFRIILNAQDKLYEYHSDYKRIAGPVEIDQ